MSARERSWPVPVALVTLSAIPLTGGTLRLPARRRPGRHPRRPPVRRLPAPARDARHRPAGGDLGFAAVHRRDIAARRAWMIRAYAIGLAAGTQLFTEGIGRATFGSGVLAADHAKGAGCVINLAVAERALRRPARRRPGRRRHALPTGPQQARALP